MIAVRKGHTKLIFWQKIFEGITSVKLVEADGIYLDFMTTNAGTIARAADAVKGNLIAVASE